jgi:alkyl hydroperoxide reductase subunit AhpF
MALLNDQDATFLRKRFGEEMVNDVRLVFFAPSTGGLALPGEDWEMAEYTRAILQEVKSLSDRVILEERSLASERELAARYGISRSPATAILGSQDYGVRYYGMPAGYEFVTLIDLVIDVSKGRAPVSDATREALSGLLADAHLQVFVTPT